MRLIASSCIERIVVKIKYFAALIDLGLSRNPSLHCSFIGLNVVLRLSIDCFSPVDGRYGDETASAEVRFCITAECPMD
jgi:hypothetical protein